MFYLVQIGVTFQPFSHLHDSDWRFFTSCFSFALFAFAAFVCSVLFVFSYFDFLFVILLYKVPLSNVSLRIQNFLPHLEK